MESAVSRQLELQQEQREQVKRDSVIRALEFGLVGALESQGTDLAGFSFKYDAFNCLMTIRAVAGGEHQVAFVGSDTIINCILKAEAAALDDRLRWKKDQFRQK